MVLTYPGGHGIPDAAKASPWVALFVKPVDMRLA